MLQHQLARGLARVALCLALAGVTSRAPAAPAPSFPPLGGPRAAEPPRSAAPPRSASSAQSPRSHAVVLRAAEVHVGDGTVHSPGEILIIDGRVREIGAKVKAPPGAVTWDAPAAVLTPGLVEPSARVALGQADPRAPVEAAVLDAADARDPYEPLLEALRASGVLAACLTPDGTGAVSGRTATVRTTGPGHAGAPVLAGAASLVVGHGGDDGSAQRAAAREILPRLFEDVAEYQGQWKEWRAAEEKREARSRGRASRVGAAPGAAHARTTAQDGKDEPRKPALSPGREVLARVLDRQLPLRVSVDRREDVLAALELARARSLSVILVGCTECAAIAREVAESRAVVLLDPLHAPLAEGPDGEPDPALARTLAEAGARLAVTGGGRFPGGAAWLRTAAAALAGAGVPRNLAIAAMTGVAADAAGCGKHVGALREGSPAEILAWDGDPLDPGTKLAAAFSMARLKDPARPPLALPTAISGVAHASAPMPLPALPLPALPQGRSFAVRAGAAFDGRTMRGPVLVVVRDGRIVAVEDGASRKAPAGIPLVDAPAAILTPGFADLDSRLGLDPRSDEPQESVSPDLRAADGLALSPLEGPALAASGVTISSLSPGRSGAVTGAGSLLQPTSTSRGAVVTRAEWGLGGSLAESGRQADRAPTSLAGQAEALRAALAAPHVPGPVRIRIDDAASLRQAARVEDAVLVGLPGPGPALVELPPESGLIASGLSPDSPLSAVSGVLEAARAGARLAFGSGSTPNAPLALRAAAARAVEAGLPPDTALAALTGTAGDLAGLGLALHLVPGAPADMVLWNGNPLSLASWPLVTWVSGEVVHRAR